jgi:hypothetical protein
MRKKQEMNEHTQQHSEALIYVDLITTVTAHIELRDRLYISAVITR